MSVEQDVQDALDPITLPVGARLSVHLTEPCACDGIGKCEGCGGTGFIFSAITYNHAGRFQQRSYKPKKA